MRRFETLHLALAPSCGLVRFSARLFIRKPCARGAPIIRFRTLPRGKSADCRSQEHRFLEQFAHEFHGGSLVAPSLHQQVEDLAFVVDCAPQPELLPAILTTTSSRCQRAVGCGRRRRSSRANNGPNFKTHRRTV